MLLRDSKKINRHMILTGSHPESKRVITLIGRIKYIYLHPIVNINIVVEL